ncbi:uncharacterized protein K444DRAFT_616191 [Hyaloscypha bicolor E]|uniref:Tetratricopeptide repeat protein 36 n=1 Tax=Hyaloscypha bicolor E TaxID=1095630 RepID=A0A2J6T013_9HELO|nr:uncharacterized protein K444DRAFT_616191 [Hyaloscypha bicolor E]PMD56365.1 hypothetical protein K444DRAFT_616191 [Hyaloscypha bicolor E]
MPSASLTNRDLFILEKIKDPESGPSAPVLIDSSLPRDPHITDDVVYQKVTQSERAIISSMQDVELQIANLKPVVSDPLAQYLSSVERLGELVEEYPDYASARNNRAQALRRIYGDGILVKGNSENLTDEATPLHNEASDEDLKAASYTILDDLSSAISLLAPATPFMAISTQAAKTLSQAYTQRGAIYHLTAKHLSKQNTGLRIDPGRTEPKWSVVDFEENASRDFMMGGRYGNEIAKALAVSANPTAKLCGEMVREAMRKEYASGGVS